MDLKYLKTLCEKGEKKIVEYKTSTACLRAAFETICAFLNSDGGTVLIGVKDDGKITGQHVSDATRKDIAKEISKIEPTASIEVNYIDIDKSKAVIAIHVETGDHAPYTYDNRPYQRDESKTNRMSQHRYEQLIIKRGQLNHSWEDATTNEYGIVELDQDEIYKTVMDGIAEKRIPASVAKESTKKILRQLSLISDDGKLKRAAIVLFGKEIKSFYTNCWLKMARFSGTDKGGDFIDNQQIHCNVFRMLEAADSFLNKHLPMASHFKPDQFKRIDKPALPVLAVREALVNAVCHRDYTDPSGYISIAIFDDKVEIWSNGTLSKKLKLGDLKRDHDSILRNKLIAQIFYLRGYIEAWGTGIRRMIDSCKEHDISSPMFSERTGGLAVTFKFIRPIGWAKKQENKQLTLRQQEILIILKKQPYSSAKIMEQLQEVPSRRTLQLNLMLLEAKGLVKREGGSRARIWSYCNPKVQ